MTDKPIICPAGEAPDACDPDVNIQPSRHPKLRRLLYAGALAILAACTSQGSPKATPTPAVAEVQDAQPSAGTFSIPRGKTFVALHPCPGPLGEVGVGFTNQGLQSVEGGNPVIGLKTGDHTIEVRSGQQVTTTVGCDGALFRVIGVTSDSGLTIQSEPGTRIDPDGIK